MSERSLRPESEMARNGDRQAHRPLTPMQKIELAKRYEVEGSGRDGIEARRWTTR